MNLEFDEVTSQKDSKEREINKKNIVTLALSNGSFIRLKEENNRDFVYKKIASEYALKIDETIDEERLFRGLIEREKLLSTAITENIAIPHPKNCEEFKFKKTTIILASLDNPIKTNPFAENSSDLLFFIFSSNPKEHLSILAKIAKIIISDRSIYEDIKSASNDEEIIDIFLKAEENL